MQFQIISLVLEQDSFHCPLTGANLTFGESSPACVANWEQVSGGDIDGTEELTQKWGEFDQDPEQTPQENIEAFLKTTELEGDYILFAAEINSRVYPGTIENFFLIRTDIAAKSEEEEADL